MNSRKRSDSAARRTAFQALQRIEGDGGFTDIVLSHVLEKSDLSARNRAFVSELVRGTIRWKKRLDWIVDQLFTGKKNQLPSEVRWLLWTGLYQIEYMRTPVFAAVNESVNIARSLKLYKWTGVINGMLRNFARNPSQIKFPDQNAEPVAWLAVTESHPEWLIERMTAQIGFEKTIAFCRGNNVAPDLSVRPNQRRISIPDFVLMLESNNVEFEASNAPGFFNIKKIDFTLREEWLHQGLMTIQDGSAGLPVLLAHPKPGEIVFDLCAAPGGKPVFAAELMNDQGVVVSGDLNIARIGLVHKAAQRMQFAAIHPVAADALHFPAQQADVVLLDAPCSGLGVLRKKPDLRWKKREADIIELHGLQMQLLKEAASRVKIGGRLLYSTCTVDVNENERIITAFLQDNPQFEVINAGLSEIPHEFITPEGFVRTWPYLHRLDGSFAAKLLKRN